MKKFAIALLLVATFSLPAAAPKRGKERLRELAVFPTVSLKGGISFSLQDVSLTEPTEQPDVADRIVRLRADLKLSPDDIRKQIELGQMLNESDDTNAAKVCFGEAERRARQKVELRPKDGLAAVDLGVALKALSKDDEAESAFRKATVLSSNSWQCWVDLGRCLDDRADYLLTTTNSSALADPSSLSVLQEMLDFHPPANAISRSLELRKEASGCFDRAVALATNESKVFLLRAYHRCISDLYAALIKHFRREEQMNPRQLMLSFYSRAAVPDVQRAAQLSPKACRLIGAAAWFERAAYSAPRSNPDSDSDFPPFDSLPAAVQQSIRGTLTRLEDLGQDPNKKQAAWALEILAGVRLLIAKEPQAIKADLQRALALDPSRDVGWEMLLIVAVESDSTMEEIVTICELRLKQTESARNHLLLAKALAKQEKFDAATSHCQTAARLETNNIVAPLMMVAISIARSSDTNFLSTAIANLYRAGDLLGREDAAERARELALDAAIVSGLNDLPKEAKNLVDQVLEHFPDDETAKEILKALEPVP